MWGGKTHCKSDSIIRPEHFDPAKFLKREAGKYYYPHLTGGETEAGKGQVSNALSCLGCLSRGYPAQRYCRCMEHPELIPT